MFLEQLREEYAVYSQRTKVCAIVFVSFAIALVVLQGAANLYVINTVMTFSFLIGLHAFFYMLNTGSKMRVQEEHRRKYAERMLEGNSRPQPPK